jgi:hypothetical protein
MMRAFAVVALLAIGSARVESDPLEHSDVVGVWKKC